VNTKRQRSEDYYNIVRGKKHINPDASMERSIEDETDWSADPWGVPMSAPKAKKLKVCNLHKEGFFALKVLSDQFWK